MWAQLDSDEALIKRMLPHANPDAQDRAHAWTQWYETAGSRAVLKFIRSQNRTPEPDEDILQDSLLTAYLDVERGGYEYRPGIPFTAYVKGIARNKILEANRRHRRWEPLDEIAELPGESVPRQLEETFEHREQREELHAAIAQLPFRRQQVMERFLVGESVTNIAALLGITAELVRQDKHRSLASLQRLGLCN